MAALISRSNSGTPSSEPSNSSKYESFRDIKLDSSSSPSKKGFFSGAKAKKILAGGEKSGPLCFSCNAPWVEEKGFLHGKHSRSCTECGVSYCADCKFDNMIKTNELSKLNEYKNIIVGDTGSNSSSHGSATGAMTSYNAGTSSGKSSVKLWICRECAKDYDIAMGNPCKACNAPWVTRNSFLGAHSQHSRACYICGVSYCHRCKYDFMSKENTTDAVRRKSLHRLGVKGSRGISHQNSNDSFSDESSPVVTLRKTTQNNGDNSTNSSFSNNSAVEKGSDGSNASELFQAKEPSQVNMTSKYPSHPSKSGVKSKSFHRFQCFTCRDEKLKSTAVNQEEEESLTTQSVTQPNEVPQHTSHPSQLSNGDHLPASSQVFSHQLPVHLPTDDGRETSLEFGADFKSRREINVTMTSKQKLGINTNDELSITKVFPQSPAHRAGLEVGWSLLEVNHQRVFSSAGVQQAMQDAFSQMSSAEHVVLLSFTVTTQ